MQLGLIYETIVCWTTYTSIRPRHGRVVKTHNPTVSCFHFQPHWPMPSSTNTLVSVGSPSSWRRFTTSLAPNSWTVTVKSAFWPRMRKEAKFSSEQAWQVNQVTTLTYVVNAKLNQQRFWHYHGRPRARHGKFFGGFGLHDFWKI